MLSISEQKFIQDVPRRLGPGDYVNLGHAGGGSAILLANGLQERDLPGTVYSVDLTFVKGCDDRMRYYEVFDRIEKCKGSTAAWAARLWFFKIDREFNFVFIDADHCYDAVVDDFQRWSPMVRRGGWVSFHDTNQDFSHQAIKDSVLKDKKWREREEDHIHRIRTFERIR
jgi:predicted O-methyltransferase YrrM